MNARSARSCAFCGSTEPLTREHVFGNWLSKIGLDGDVGETVAGRLNQIGKRMGVSRPFQTKVKNVCAACNGGWMSNLESTAARVLTPLALGQRGQIALADQGAVAAWVQKTALMAMYLSSAQEREDGHGLPPSEYAYLFEQRNSVQPLPNSRFWVARYTGSLGLGAVWVTPVAVNIEGLPEPELPHGYAMTIVVGAVLLHGIRFTDLPFSIDLATVRPLEEIWPAIDDVECPQGLDVSDEDFLHLAQGREFVLADNGLSLRPMRPLINSPRSEINGAMIEMPTPCGQKHVVYYPAVLAEAGMRGTFHWFWTECECGVAYLVHTESTGAHVKSAGDRERIRLRYEAILGRDQTIQDPNGDFTYK